MVFESLVADVLNRFLGDYVENLDKSQLKIGIWGGDVVLQNLLLKENALNELDLPIRTVAGRLGKLTLKIPWKSLYTAPVIAKIECLDLLAVPNSGIVYNAEKEEKNKKDAKKKELERIEAAKLKEQEEKEKKPQAEDSFVEKLVAQIIKNLQVKVVDIHIRYEDTFTNPSQPFAFGVTLHDLSFDTTDDKWNLQPSDQDTASKFIFKLIALDSLSLYWNSQCQLYSVLPQAECQEAFQKDIATSRFRPQNVSYMLGPINSSAHLRLNMKPETDGSEYTEPKLRLAVDMEEISLSLGKLQYLDIMELLQALERIAAASLYRQYRPSVPVKGNAKQWWLFAYTCVVEDGVRRRKRNWSWPRMVSHRSACRHYKEMYREKLLSNAKPTDDIKKRLEDLEEELDVFNITLARKQAEVEYARLGIKPKAEPGWISSWFSWGKQQKEDDTGIVKQFEKAMSADEKSKLYSAIGYQESDAPTAYPHMFVENQFSFRLHNLAIAVKDNDLKEPEVLTFGLDDVNVHMEMRPSAQAIKLKTTVGGLKAFGLKSGGSSAPVIVRSLTEKSAALLDVLVETNPLDRSCDQRVHVTAQPLEIVFHAESVNRLSEVFKPPETVTLSSLQEAARSKLEDFKELSATGLQHAIAEHKVLDVNINISGSHVIVPENGNYTSDCSVIVAELGNLHMYSVNKDPSSPNLKDMTADGSSEADRLKRMLDQSYDNFAVELKGMQVILASPGDDWQEARKHDVTPLHLLKQTNINIQLQKCLFMDDPRLPKMKVIGSLPSFHVVLSDVRLLQLAAIALSIPTPQGPPDLDADLQIELPAVGDEKPAAADVISRVFDESKAIKNLTKTDDADKKPEKTTTAIASESVQFTNLELSFEIGEVCVTIIKQTESVETALMSFVVAGLGVNFKQRTYDMCANVYVGGMTLEHQQFRSVRGGPLYIVHTPRTTEGVSSEKLFALMYLSADVRGPDFATTYNSTNQLLRVSFSRLGVVLHQEAILAVMAFADDLQKRLDEVQKRLKPESEAPRRQRRPSSTRSVSSSFMMELTRDVAANPIRRRKKDADNLIDIKIDAFMDNFQIVVSNSEHEVTDINITGLEAGVSVKKSSTTVETKLKNIVVRDPTVDAVYREILSIVGSDAFQAKIINYNDATKGSGYYDASAVDTSLSVSIGCIQIVFLNRFVAELLEFMNNFQSAKDKAIEASAAAAEAAKQNVQNAYQKAVRVQVDFRMKAPVVVIPRNSRSKHVLVADLGVLSLSNKFAIGSGASGQQLGISKRPLILDSIAIGLENLKLSRAVLEPNSSSIETECPLLEPISFTLNVKRNLTAGFYKDVPEIDVSGRLAAISLVTTQEDYSTLMLILNENLSEGQVIPAQQVSEENDVQLTIEVPTGLPVIAEDEEPSDDKIYTRIKFVFELESVRIQLLTGSSFLEDKTPEKRLEHPLAKFELSTLAVKGEMRTDNSIFANVVLVNCILDDSRTGRKSAITRLMDRKLSSPVNGAAAATAVAVTGLCNRSMIDVTFMQKAEGDKFVDVKIMSFTLILSVEYLMTLANFFAVEETAAKSAVTEASKTRALKPVQPSQPPSPPPASASAIELKLRLDCPDIILLEDMSDPHSAGIIFNNEVSVTVRINAEKMMVMVDVSNLQLLTYCCNPDNQGTAGAQILSPTRISVVLSARTGQGMHIDVNMSEIIIRISPATIRLLTAISSSFAAQPAIEEQGTVVEPNDYSTLWQIKPWKDENFWFIKTELAEEAFDLVGVTEAVVDVGSRRDLLILEMKTIIVTLEAGVGTRTVPMMLLELSFTGEVRDWSAQLSVGSSLSVEAAYYNERLAMWEPLIEPVEGDNDRRSWELIVEVRKNDEFSDVSPEEDSDEIHFQPAAMTLNVISQDNLELTVTKTALEVVSSLGKAFGEAVSKDVPVKKELPLSPYTVRNNTGLAITLLLKEKDFELFEGDANEIHEVVLEKDASVSLVLKQHRRSSEHVGKSVLREQDSKEEYFLMIKLTDMNVIRELAVTRADKRYISLPHRTYPGDQWGLVADVSAEYGYKTITLRSHVQVFNHFTVPVEVYYMLQGGNEVKFCGIAKAKEFLNLPLEAVYTPTNELFFRPIHNGYSVSAVPFVWKELLKDPHLGKVLQCNAREPGGDPPFFMNAIGEIEQVYFENSQKKTIASTCFVIHLHPTVILCNILPLPFAYNLKGTSEEFLLDSGDSKELLNAEINSSTISLKIVNYQGLNWICSKRLTAQMEEVWTFESVDNKKTTLDFGAHIQYDGGFIHISLYCPFWMMNKTGLQLTYRPHESSCNLLHKLSNCMHPTPPSPALWYDADTAQSPPLPRPKTCCIRCPFKRSKKADKNSSQASPAKADDLMNLVAHPADVTEPILFSFRPKVFFSKKKANLKIEGSEWSDKFSLDAVGSSGSVTCNTKNGPSYEVGVQIYLSGLGLSKIVVFSPFYMLVNHASYDVEVREYLADNEWITVSSGQCVPFWPKHQAKNKEIVLRVAGTSELTKACGYQTVHSVLLSLDNSKGGLYVECYITEASTIVTIDEYMDGMATVRLVNHCQTAVIDYHQSGLKEKHILKPCEYQLYTWEDPIGAQEFLWSSCGKHECKSGLVADGIGEYTFNEDANIYWASFLDGMQRVMMFTDDLALATTAQCAGELERADQEINLSFCGIGFSLVDDILRREVIYIALTSSGILWEFSKPNGRRYRPFNVKECQVLETAYQRYVMEIKMNKKPKKRQILDGKMEVDFQEEAMYRPQHRRIRRTFQTGLWTQIKTSPHQLQLHTKINRLQIDNQLEDAVFPTVLAPVPIPKSVAADTAPKPFTEASIILRKNEHSTVQQYKYFKVLVQEFHVKVDQGFINAIISLFTPEKPKETNKHEYVDADLKTAKTELMELVSITASQGQKNFYDMLHFSPLKVHISFSMQGGGGGGNASDGPKKPTQIHSDFINLLLQSVGVTLTEINDVVFKLGFFEREHVFMSQQQLTGEAVSHYASQAVKQMYVLVLGLDVIGNPFGLVTGLGKGVEDLFYEPFQGAIQGPEEFAEGLALGIKSLFGHAVGGAAGVVSRITGTLGKGVAVLTMDDEYQRKRREALNRKPANLQEGLARSGKGLVMGVFDGVTGVFVKPLEGAKEEGVEGFFKGVGKGVVGLVTRPTSGVIDFASGSFDAVKRATDTSEDTHRIRPPRYIHPDGILRSYNRHEAEGNKLLHELEKGKYAVTDHYVAHAVVTPDGKNVFLITNNRMIMVSKGDIFGQWNCDWYVTWGELKESPRVTDKGLHIVLKEAKKKKLGLFGSSHSTRVVAFKSQEVSNWILDKVEQTKKKSG